MASHGGIAIGRVEYQRQERASRAVRLAPRPEFLVGREGLLAELDDLLAGGDSPWPRVAALHGLGGAGKTSVAVEYAHRHLAEVGVAWQFAAEDAAVLAAEFGELAAQLGVPNLDGRDPVASVHGALAASAEPWLLVFDNAPDRGSVARFLPPAGKGWVLITSQSAVWPRGRAVEVAVLDAEVSAGFLVRRAGDGDERAARDLAQELGGLPLALAQAAAYIHVTGTSLAGYLAVFRDRRADLLARGEAPGHPATVAATLGLAVSQLEVEAPAAAGLLRLLACLAPEPVPLGLLLSDAQIADELDLRVAVVLRSLLGDPVAAWDAVAALRRYSLVTPAGDGMVLVHRLVQTITLAQAPMDMAAHWEDAAAVLVEAAIPEDTGRPATWPVIAMLLPHARAVLGLTSYGMWQLAQYLSDSGSSPAALDLFRLIAEAHAEDDAYGPEHPATLAARANLIMCIKHVGNVAEARDLYAVLLPYFDRVFGPEDLETLIVRNVFAAITGEAGDAAGARDQYAALVNFEERVLGAEHRETLTNRANLAAWTGEAGNAAAARDQYAALLPIYERVLGPEYPDSLAILANIAYWTGMAGDWAGARDQLAALLPIRERDLGPEHPDTLHTRGDLADWTGRAGDAGGARDQYAALLPIYERVLGPEHPDTLAILAKLAYWTGMAGDWAGARDQLAALLPIRERALGPEHPDTLHTRGDLADWTVTPRPVSSTGSC